MTSNGNNPNPEVVREGDIINVWFSNKCDGNIYLFQKVYYKDHWVLMSASSDCSEEEAIRITVEEIENE